jgi:hypothetical protein
MCGSSPSAPEDKSDEVARINAEEAARAREEERRQEEAARKRFEDALASAYATSQQSASNYFSSQGLDPSTYEGDIAAALASARSRVPDLDSSPGTYFEGLGAQLYNSLQDASRARASRSIDPIFSSGFAKNRITDTVDDPYLASILDDQFGEAQSYIDNLLQRNVITDSGYAAALKDLENQKSGARLSLEDLGRSTIESGRTSLRDIASNARNTASNLNLGDIFDISSYEQEANKAQEDFFANLADSLRASAPSDLFDTSSLANIAGQRQGAGNTAFDPQALAVIFGTDAETIDEGTDEDEEATKKEENFVSF